jgi:hypothetical protein
MGEAVGCSENKLLVFGGIISNPETAHGEIVQLFVIL